MLYPQGVSGIQEFLLPLDLRTQRPGSRLFLAFGLIYSRLFFFFLALCKRSSAVPGFKYILQSIPLTVNRK
jgi:hypothetical protein